MKTLTGVTVAAAAHSISPKVEADMTVGRRNALKQFWALLWLAGVAMIICYAPSDYRTLHLADGEQVIGFRGPSYELIIVSGGPKQKPLPAGAVPPQPSRKTVKRYIGQEGTLGDTIHLWNLASDAKRDLPLEGSVELFGVTPCPDGSRIFIEYFSKPYRPTESPPTDIGFRMAAVDGQTGKVIRTIDSWPNALQSLSDTGKIMVYMVDSNRIKCLDVDSGRRLYWGWGSNGIISPSGKYLAVLGFLGLEHRILDLDEQRQVGSAADWDIEGITFSPQSDKYSWVVSRNTDVLYTASNKVIEAVPDACIFVNDGKGIAWTGPSQGGLALMFRDIEAHRPLASRTIQIPEWPGSIETVDAKGNFVCLSATKQPGDLTWPQKILDWLGYKQTAPAKGPHHWLLIDAKSGKVLDQGRDELLAVSSDGRYIVSRDWGKTGLKVYELPLQRSMLFIALVGALWTMVVLVGRRLWRRRLKPLVSDAIEPAAASA
jgi:hypothetical protein